MKILLIEDEDLIASFVERGLRAHGFEPERVATGAEGVARSADRADLVVLDLGLPDMDGFDVLRRIQETSPGLPVVILTARGEVEDRVQGLDAGADDYIVKPFAFDELLARIHARVRTSQRSSIGVGPLRLDLAARTARLHGETFRLTSRQFELLEALVRRAGEVVSRPELLERVWGIEFDPRSNVVDVYVGMLRRRLGQGVIETMRGEGYRLNPDALRGDPSG